MAIIARIRSTLTEIMIINEGANESFYCQNLGGISYNFFGFDGGIGNKKCFKIKLVFLLYYLLLFSSVLKLDFIVTIMPQTSTYF